MPVSRARTIAFDVLRRVATQDAYADEVLRTELTQSVRREDAGLATELTLGTLRWQRLLDVLIDASLTHATRALDIEVRIALRLGAYQLWFLGRVPARAAVHESVDLVKRARKRSAAPMVNAVLRKIAKQAAELRQARSALVSLPPKDMPSYETLGILHSHPSWLVERWVRTLGEDDARALLVANNATPEQSGYLLRAERSADARASLEQSGCVVGPGRLLRSAWTLQGGNPAASEALKRSWVVIQDEASQAVAHLLDVKPREKVLDLCAAPGGKTLWLARAAGEQGHIIAADLHEHRVRAMRERFERAAVSNVACVTLDGAQPLPFDQRFDRILVDAPCSGTGTLARHPEIRWRLRPEDLVDLHARQVRLLRNALEHLAPGGRLVYSTCSLEPEENELVVNEALSGLQEAFRVAAPRGVLQSMLREDIPAETVLREDGFFRTSPSKHGTDGFFAAVIERADGKTEWENTRRATAGLEAHAFAC